jgi:hypothetical protein
VRERPVDISDSDVAAALDRQWALTAQDMSYLSVGFGGYHWSAVDQTGSRWFVTVSDLASPWVPDLSAAMQTAAWLATQARLGFVAPVPTRAGQVVGSLDSRHALTLFPYVDAAPSNFEDPIDDGDRAAIIDMLARLHTAIPKGIQVPSRPLELGTRQAIDQALGSLGVPWTGGPYAERLPPEAPATAGTHTHLSQRSQNALSALIPAQIVAQIVFGVRSGVRHPRQLTAHVIASETFNTALRVLVAARAVQRRRPRIAAGRALSAAGSLARLRAASAEPLQ